MEKQKAIEFLKGKIKEIPELKKIHHTDRKVIEWRDSIENMLEYTFGRDSYEFKLFYNTRHGQFKHQAYNQQTYFIQLQLRENTLLLIIEKNEKSLGSIAREELINIAKPKAFIAHGGESPSLKKLKNFLFALGVEPVIVEEQPSGGKSVGEKVDYYARQSDFAIILATKGDKDSKSGGFIPRGNVLIEIGKAQEIFPDKIIYLLQAGTKFPSNISEKVWVRFVPQSMDDAFTRIAQEIREFGILKATKTPSANKE